MNDNKSACELPLIESLLNGGRVADCRQIVPDSTYFIDAGAAEIYNTILGLAADGIAITPEIVTDHLDLRSEPVKLAWLETAGSTKGIAGAPPEYVAFFAAEVADAHQARATKTAVRRLGQSDDVTPDEIAGAAEMLRKLRPAGATTHAIRAVMQRTVDQIEENYARRQRGETIHGIPYGIRALDATTGGMHPGQLIIVGARPSIGKTALALSIVDHAAVDAGKAVLFVSLEMTETQDALRLLSIRSGSSYQDVDQGSLTKLGAPKVYEAMQKIAESNLMIETKPGLTMPELAAQVHSLARDGAVDLVVIDYLGLMRYPQYSSGDSNYKEVSEISKGLKELALGAKVPILALAQLNRGSAKHARAPKMSDLRDSGSIEQDADLVILLHRDDEIRIAHESAEIEPALAIVDKNRNGATGRVRLEFNKPTMTFRDWDRGDWPDDF